MKKPASFGAGFFLYILIKKFGCSWRKYAVNLGWNTSATRIAFDFIRFLDAVSGNS